MRIDLTRTSLFIGLLFASLSLAACSASHDRRLAVELVTGLVSGAEFAYVETTLLENRGRATDPRNYVVRDSVEARAPYGADYQQGQRVAAFDVGSGGYMVNVRLKRADGSLLAEQNVLVILNNDYIVRVHVTRDCVGVECPGAGSAELIACIAGQCVDPRCDDQHPEYCPEITFCRDAASCGPTAACATQDCIDGLCVEQPVEDACELDEWCNPDATAGCLPFPTGPLDSRCGTICNISANACRFGYWNCDRGAPFCDVLINRPVNTVCGPRSVCDEVGECVISTTTPPGVVVSPNIGLVTSEMGGTATVAVSLATAPSADVTLTLSSTDVGEGTVAPDTLVFTSANWMMAQDVVITGVDDVEADGTQNYAMRIDASSSDTHYNFRSDDVPVSNTDDESAGITVSPTTGLSVSEGAGTAPFSVRLNTMPTANVTIALSSSDPLHVTLMSSSLTFMPSNWEIPQFVTVVGVDNDIDDGDQMFTIVTNAATSTDAEYDGIDPDDVEVTTVDNDTAGVVVTPTSGLVTTEAGGTAAFSVRLTSQPTESVQIHFTSENELEGSAAPSMLIFEPGIWSIPQVVTVSGVDDALSDGDVAYSIASSAVSADSNYSGVSVTSVSVTNVDDDFVPYTQEAYIKAFNTGASDNFGQSVAISSDGTTLVVGARNESSNDTGVGGMGTDNSAMNSGAVYVFVRTGSAWRQEAYIKASNTGAGDVFGFSVAISGDGNTVAVGAYNEASNATGINGNQADNSAPNAGAVYVFTRSGTVWSQEAYIKASNAGAGDRLGYGLTLSENGNTLGVGAYVEGSSATGVNGNQADNSAPTSGAAYVFTRAGTVWSQQAYIKASNTGSIDAFGLAVALSGDGNTFAVGAYGEGSNATGIGGNQADDSANAAGALYVFTRAGSVWSQQAYIKESNTNAGDWFGWSASLSDNGNTLAVGALNEASNATGVGGNQADNSAPNAGAVYVFTRTGTVWTQQAYVKASNTASNDNFGYVVSISGDGNILGVGAMGENGSGLGVNADDSLGGAALSGALYMFNRTGSVWSQDAYIKASNAAAVDFFAQSISVSRDGLWIAVGAGGEASAATGIDGDESNNAAGGAGAAYVFLTH